MKTESAMSIGALADAGRLGEEFKDMTLEQFKEYVTKSFWQTYGRYENASGKMFVDIEHAGTAEDHTLGSVKWRKSEMDNNGVFQIIKDEVLEREQAIPRYFKLVEKGYSRVFKAVTPEDFERESAKLALEQSALMREGVMGTYFLGDYLFRINEYEKGLYSTERGYKGMVTGSRHELTEAEARCELDYALADGYRREGEELDTAGGFNYEAFGIEPPEDVARETQVKAGEFDASAFASMFGDD